MTIPLYKSREITAFRQGKLEVVDDVVVYEKPLTLFVNHLGHCRASFIKYNMARPLPQRFQIKVA